MKKEKALDVILPLTSSYASPVSAIRCNNASQARMSRGNKINKKTNLFFFVDERILK